MSITIKLNPCPRCGREPKLYSFTRFYYYCCACGVRVGAATDPTSAAIKWNAEATQEVWCRDSSSAN